MDNVDNFFCDVKDLINIWMEWADVVQTTLPGFFPVQCCLEPLRQHCTGFFFLHNVVSETLGQHCLRFFLCNTDEILSIFYHH